MADLKWVVKLLADSSGHSPYKIKTGQLLSNSKEWNLFSFHAFGKLQLIRERKKKCLLKNGSSIRNVHWYISLWSKSSHQEKFPVVETSLMVFHVFMLRDKRWICALRRILDSGEFHFHMKLNSYNFLHNFRKKLCEECQFISAEPACKFCQLYLQCSWLLIKCNCTSFYSYLCIICQIFLFHFDFTVLIKC